MGTQAHKHHAPASVRIGILSASTTRAIDADESGHWLKKRAIQEGHAVVAHRVVRDDVDAIRAAIRELVALETPPQVILMNGGTGISPKDVTIEAVRPLFTKELTAFSVLFAQLSFDEIDSAAILSRASAGIIDGVAVFCMPGSLKACKLAAKNLIFPELGHIVGHMCGG